MARRFVRIDALPESAWRYSRYDAIVCVDVLLSATTVVTAVAQGRRVFLVPTPREGLRLKSRMADAALVTDSLDRSEGPVTFAGPVWVAAGDGRAQDLVHVSPLAEMLAAGVPGATVYVACLRNLASTADEIARRHRRVAILAVGEDDEICTEDQMTAAWLAARLKRKGFGLEGRNTVNEVARWGHPDVSLVGWSRSAERLRSRGRAEDVDFVLRHVDDLDLVCAYGHGELRPALRPVASRPLAPAVGWGLPGLPLPAEGS
ncbi:MAG: 2-phosphosulfolactate phosphatase [Acidobacteriota bacterium]|jgi:phosphosulfolactate phosphohydrolase-like enzyme